MTNPKQKKKKQDSARQPIGSQSRGQRASDPEVAPSGNGRRGRGTDTIQRLEHVGRLLGIVLERLM